MPSSGSTASSSRAFPGLDPPPEVPPDFGHRAYETMFRTEAMRAMILRQPVIVPGGTVSVSVMVGETLKGRDALIRSLWVRGFVEEATLVLAGALSIWIGINRELRPILSLRRAVLDRPADRFEPFDSSSVQSEIRPLVEALNSHMQRLERQLRRQRRFLDSAAHQLRTPLAVMKTQIGYARRTREATDSALALEAIDGNLSAMSRLTSQLLTLGRVEHDRASLRAETVDLGLVVRAAVAEAAPRALDHGVELALDLAGHCPVTGTTMLVTEMANNLIDNAIRHAGAGAVATVSVRRSGATAMMVVEDDGAGASDDDRASLLERFRRGRNTPIGRQRSRPLHRCRDRRDVRGNGRDTRARRRAGILRRRPPSSYRARRSTIRRHRRVARERALTSCRRWPCRRIPSCRSSRDRWACS